MVDFNSKEWKDRVPEFPGRRQITPVEGESDLFDVERADGAAIVEGDWFNADTMNDLERRIGKLAGDTASALDGHTEDIATLDESLDSLYASAWRAFEDADADEPTWYMEAPDGMRDVWAVTPNLGLHPAESDTEKGSGMVGTPMNPYQYMFAKLFTGDLFGNAYSSGGLVYEKLLPGAQLDMLRGMDKATMYWAEAGNSFESKPESVDGFWLMPVRTGKSSALQILFAAQPADYSGLWVRAWDGTTESVEEVERPVWGAWRNRLTEIDTALKPVRVTDLDADPATWGLPFGVSQENIGKPMRIYGISSTAGLPWTSYWSGTFTYTHLDGYGCLHIYRAVSPEAGHSTELAIRFWRASANGKAWTPWRLLGSDVGSAEQPYVNVYAETQDSGEKNLQLKTKAYSASLSNASGALSPGVNGTQSVGTADRKWKNGHFSSDVYTKNLRLEGEGAIYSNLNNNRKIIDIKSGDENGDGLLISAGGLTVIGSGEFPENYFAAKPNGYDASAEHMIVGSDNFVVLTAGYQTPGNAKYAVFDNDGAFRPMKPSNGVGGAATTIGTSADRWSNIYSTAGNFSGSVAVATPTTDGHATTKKYVDGAVTDLKNAALLKADYDANGDGKVDKAELADKATQLATARNLRTNLASTATAAFNGTADVAPGVSGILPIANGGTGNTTGTAKDSEKLNGQAASYYATATGLNSLKDAALLKADYDANGDGKVDKAELADKATQLATARNLRTNLASTATAAFNGTADIAPGVTGILPIANGGTGNATGKAKDSEKLNGQAASYYATATGLNSLKDAALLKADYDANGDGKVDKAELADKATQLATARNLRTNLASTATAAFNGTADIAPGVTGTLPVANGGTGNTTGKAADSAKLNGQEAAYYATATAVNAKANTADVLTRNNTTAYTPTANYHPATKTYVDSAVSAKGNGDMLKSVYDTNNDGVVDKAAILETARTIRTNLASTSTASFNGSANVAPGVTGTLPIANGGTGNTTGKAADSAKLNGQEAAYYATATAVNAKANTADVLTKTNTTAFTPTANYHPATKTYVDSAVSAKGNGDMLKSVYDTNNDGVVDKASKLEAARTIRTNLASTSTASFDGSANVAPGVTGTLPIANGGTGNTTGKAADSAKLNGQEASYYATATAVNAKANTADVLTKTNTTTYTPTADYHPATKAYVDSRSSGTYVHAANAGGGTAGLLRIARFTIKGTYLDAPIEIIISQRLRTALTHLSIQFSGIDGSDPTLASFTYTGASCSAYLHKAATSTWDLYITKAGSYDNIAIINYKNPPYNTARMTTQWTDVLVASVPSGSRQATTTSYMPVTGGNFTGNVAAYNTNRTGANLRNIRVQNSTGTAEISTGYILMRRK